jgi:hypothetical protein
VGRNFRFNKAALEQQAIKYKENLRIKGIIFNDKKCELRA